MIKIGDGNYSLILYFTELLEEDIESIKVGITIHLILKIYIFRITHVCMEEFLAVFRNKSYV